MTPRTKIQKRVVKLSRALPPLTQKQEEWAREKMFDKKGYLRVRQIWCLECGARFKSNFELVAVIGAKCPECNTELNITTSNKRKYEESYYYTIFTRKKEFQVMRHFIVTKMCKVGYPKEITIEECVQNWIHPDGRLENIARNTFMSMYYDLWDWRSPMEVRGRSTVPGKYSIYAKFIYPHKRIIPELRRNGFKGGLYDIEPYYLLPAILKKPRLETLFKAKQFGLLRYFIHREDQDLDEYWPSIRICMRNNYIIKPDDAVTWCDYIRMLKRQGRDVRNSHYVCPANLEAEHDKYVERIQLINDKKRAEQKKARAKEDEAEYQEFIGKFKDVFISNGKITVEPLKSVYEFIKESEVMRHCVFASDYHKKRGSLIMSAKVNGERTETVEFSLDEQRVIQSRGLQNQNTDYHSQIVELVNSHSDVIVAKAGG